MGRFSLLNLLFSSLVLAQDDPTRFFDPKNRPADGRSKVRDLNGYFPFEPPTTRESWNDRRTAVRTRLLVANGLWPMPEKTPLNPVIHGKIERDGYTIEKVYFASTPGHYVTGNLYRPTAPATGKRPAVLSPHGHWPPEGPNGGRLYEATEQQAKAEIKRGAEKTMAGAQYPLQARCAQLARMGCIVFHYDMIGYADSQAIKHRTGFMDAEAELRSQSLMGMQTWNTIRSLDFLVSLPDVDPARIGVTGSSGGGTQTFILGAIDDRPAVAFPAVMVSTAMQGGCQCENCSYLRIGTGNVEMAAMFAPKPLAMSAANDWTRDIETKGYPELKQLYALLGAEDKVLARCWPEFGHNYNQVAREMMYTWFNKHLLGGSGDVKEQPFVPVPPKELNVFDATHPRPKDELGAKELRSKLTAASDAQMAKLLPADAASAGEYRRVVGSALEVMLGGKIGAPGTLVVKQGPKEVKLDDGAVMHLAVFQRKGGGEVVPMAGVFNKTFRDKVVIWAHPNGKASLFNDGKLVPAAKSLVEKGFAVVAMDTFETGEMRPEKPFPVNTGFAGYTYGYNQPVFANRAQDILTATMFARDMLRAKTIHLIGWEGAGPWAAAARAMAGNLITQTAIDANQFAFERINDVRDPNLLPGALKIGGLPAIIALAAPDSIVVHNVPESFSEKAPKAMYSAVQSTRLQIQAKKLSMEEVVDLITR